MTMLLDELPSPVYVKDSSGVFIYANGAFLSLMEQPLEAVLGKRIQDFNSSSLNVKSHHSDMSLTRETPESEIVTNLIRSNGDEHIILARKRLFDLPNGETGIICILNDISQFVRYEKELEEKHRELRRQQGKLKKLATIDPLTGIFNRRAFYDKAKEIISYADVGDLEVGVLMFDLDKFKNLNDTYGHAVGDEVLVRFTKILSDCIRGSDIFARLGGEEFALLLPDTNERAVRAIAERIRERTAETPVMVNQEPVYYTTSVGGTMWRNDEKSIETALNRADERLYKAKEDGRNLVRFSQATSARSADAA